VRRRDKERIARLEQTGVMDQRREEIRGWFEKYPHASALDAIQALGYSYPDHMHVIADSIRMDLTRGHDTAQCHLTGERPYARQRRPGRAGTSDLAADGL
jgi:hypothetical protein